MDETCVTFIVLNEVKKTNFLRETVMVLYQRYEKIVENNIQSLST